MKLVSLTLVLAFLAWVFHPLPHLSLSPRRGLIPSPETAVEIFEKVGELTGPNPLWCWCMKQVRESMELLDGPLRQRCCDD